jgi:xylulokinase
MYSMGLWKTHFVIGTKASGLSLTKPNWFSQHDQPTTLHTLGIALKWLRDNCSSVQAAEAMAAGKSAYDLMLSDIPDAPTGLFFFPYLLGTGTPWLDSQARATIWGLTSSTTNRQLVKAALEGVCFQMRWNLEIFGSIGIRVDRVLAVGGGAKSELWLQLKADIFERPVVAVPGEASSRGAAICAGMGVSAYSGWHEAIAAVVRLGRVFEPRPAMQRQYGDLFEQYKELAQRLYGHRSWPSGSNSNTGV